MKILIETKIPPNEHAQQRIKDGCPVCNHESVIEQVASSQLAVPKSLWPKFEAHVICSVCLQWLLVTLRSDGAAEVSEIDA